MSDDCLGVAHYSLHNVNNQKYTVDQTNGTGDFVDEVDMSRRVNQVYEMRLSITGLENHGHRRGLDGDLSLAGEDVCIRVASLQNHI